MKDWQIMPVLFHISGDRQKIIPKAEIIKIKKDNKI